MKDKYLSLIFVYTVLLFVTLSFVSAVPPVTTLQQFSEGYEIQVPQDNILTQKKDYSFEFHIFNVSNGRPIISGVNCSFHLYNSSGSHIFVGYDDTVSSDLDYSFFLTKGNFSSLGALYYFIQCNSTLYGGFGESIIRVTPNGEEFSSNQAIIYILVLLADLLFLSIFIFLSFTVPYDNEGKDTNNGPVVTKVTKVKYIKIMSIWISYGLYLVLLTILTGIVNNYLSFEPVSIMINNVYIFSSFLGYGVSIFMVWFIFFNIWKDIILNKIILKEGMAVIRDLK
jgi:hypothetical protein